MDVLPNISSRRQSCNLHKNIVGHRRQQVAENLLLLRLPNPIRKIRHFDFFSSTSLGCDLLSRRNSSSIEEPSQLCVTKGGEDLCLPDSIIDTHQFL